MNSTDRMLMTELSSVSWLKKIRVRRWLRKCSAYVRTCRVSMQSASSLTLIRLVYVIQSSNYSAAEKQSEQTLARLLQENAFGSEHVREVNWKRGRLITPQTLESEDIDIQRAIAHLATGQLKELTAFERVENYQSKSVAIASPLSA